MEPGNDEVQRVVDETAAAFEEQNEGTSVEIQYVPWASAHDQFVTAIGGGQVPDVAEMGTTWTAEFAELGGLAPVEGGLGDEYVESLVEAGTVDDTAYGYPWYAGARALIYRTDIFEEASVEVPETWEDLITVSQTIAESTDVAPIHIAGVYTHMMVPMIWQAGGEIATLEGDTWTPGVDTEAGRQALQTYVDLAEWSPEGAIQWNSVDVRDAFANGDSAMMVGGGWDLSAILAANPDLEGNVGVAMLPAGPGGNNDTFAGGSHLVTFQGSENPELASAFIDFMLQPENVSTFAEQVGFLPGTVSGVEASSAAGDELYGPFVTQLVDHSRSYPATAGWGAVEGDATLTNGIQQVMQGSLSVEEAAAQIDATMSELLNG
ncbi:MAG: extracellular solute-binding protein [Acidimicrobiia bacterium]|nr:extracellular solute-binding protein [Acidimicrobiia bacterium]